MKNGFLPFFRLLPAWHSAPLKSAPIHYCLSENTMKKTLALALLLSLPMLGQAQDGEKNSGLIKSVSGAVSGAVQSGKDIIKGVKQGWDEGRQGGASLDDAVIISPWCFLTLVSEMTSMKKARKMKAIKSPACQVWMLL